jgi:hypothetical protein
MSIPMQGLTTVVVVHATAAPNRPLLVALCDQHTALLQRAARIDELVGFSAIADCEACALISTAGQESDEIARVGPAPVPRAIPRPA